MIPLLTGPRYRYSLRRTKDGGEVYSGPDKPDPIPGHTCTRRLYVETPGKYGPSELGKHEKVF